MCVWGGGGGGGADFLLVLFFFSFFFPTAGYSGDGGTPVASVICLTSLSGHPCSPAESGPH